MDILLFSSFLPFFVLTLINYVMTDMDFTYSVSDLYRLVQTEQRLSKILDNIGKEVDDFSSTLNTHRNVKLVENSADTILKNPILSYHLVKRHGMDLEIFDQVVLNFTAKIAELQASYNKVRTQFTNPTKNDFEQSMEAIVRIRQTYNLSVAELSNGRVSNLQMEGSLSPSDLASIGFYSTKKGMTGNAKLFLSTALSKYEESSVDSIKLNNGWVKGAKIVLQKLQQKSSDKQDREDFQVLTEMDLMFATDSLENLNDAFQDLCQMNAVKEAPISKFKCYLDKHSHPIRQLSPLKMEVYHEDPQIVVIYDFMSDSEIEAIESATFYSLKRSVIQVFEKGALTMEPSIIRTTSQTWIHDLGHPQFGYLSKRIESLTGYYLSGKYSAEEIQVASYRPGGHYSLHTDATQEEILKDFLTSTDLMKGDRVATFMLYLSDVEMGGNTVFPMMNVSVQPVKGSAILWGNLFPDGNIDRHTLHGACPIVYGIKNIATKWIRANDQMFTRHKCKPDKTQDHYNLHDKDVINHFTF